MLHVPLKGGGDVLVELLAKRAQASVVPINVALPFGKDQRLKLLAVSGAKRSRFLPDLPTLAESGVPGYSFQSWLGLLGPAGLPGEVVESLDAQRSRLLADPAILERLNRQGVSRRADERAIRRNAGWPRTAVGGCRPALRSAAGLNSLSTSR
jgi:tripartite-type tricarboxylate transporter receptor subunit TctC